MIILFVFKELFINYLQIIQTILRLIMNHSDIFPCISNDIHLLFYLSNHLYPNAPIYIYQYYQLFILFHFYESKICI